MTPITPDPRPTVAVLGGGPGGLLTAYFLEHVYHAPVEVTIFEATDRVGGKVVTRTLAGATYEAGAAELYDYSDLGPDPLREMVDALGLTTYSMDGRAVFVGDAIVADDGDVGRVLGPAAGEAVAAFNGRGRRAISTAEYYESDWRADNADPLCRQTFAELLAGIPDAAARRYVAAAVHSDVATEPRHTSAAYGLQNWLMNEPGYMKLYGIDGGLERLPRAIAARLSAEIRLNSRVTAVTAEDDRYRIAVAGGGPPEGFDYCVAALPNYLLPAIRWGGDTLARAVADHHAHYDHPADYLRVTVAFRRPFWRGVITGSWFMLDALGGCCVYDESARCPDPPGSVAVLGWLIAGDAARTLSNLEDRALVAHVLEELPRPAGRRTGAGGRRPRPPVGRGRERPARRVPAPRPPTPGTCPTRSTTRRSSSSAITCSTRR